jgi:hypothetical protein
MTSNDYILWKGKIPETYIDYIDRSTFNKAYSIEINQIDAIMKQLGAKFWSMNSKIAFVKALSYGYFDDTELCELSSIGPHFANYERFPCRFEYEGDEAAAQKLCREKLAPMKAVLQIWAEILKENCLMLDLREFDPADDIKVSKFLKVGQIFGVDSAMQAYYDCGVPVEDILA